MPLRFLALALLAGSITADDGLEYWLPQNRDAHRAFEKRLTSTVDAARLRGFHDDLASRPHPAGSEGDHAVAARLAAAFQEFGLEVEKQEIWCYLATPKSGAVEVVAPERIVLAVKEEAVDKYVDRPGTSIGWNAFSGSGEATGEVVYANYGRKEDYEKLDALGIDLKGKIVVARYGGNFRGYKAKFAEARGAAGLVIYTDPYDSGYFKGIPYPEGGYANESYIQRGSILVLPYRGDPLTPFTAATKDAKRLDPKDVAFPTIPVQPIGHGAANEILKRMTGDAVPKDWQGALPFAYRVTGGKELRVRVAVQQERKLTQTFNVAGWLRGSKHPEQIVVVGAHHDAWGFGAGDPTAGTILVLEAARCFAAAAKAGKRPARTIVFAGWAAEEYGIMGSTEWVEGHSKELSAGGVAYLNLDMAAMGPDVRSSAAPSLKRVIADACRAEGSELKKFGNLGGGSDHLGFYCHLGIPAGALAAGGSKGVSYHSMYDNLDWYRKVVGSDYAPAAKLTRIINRFLARLADGDLLPLDPVAYGADAKMHVVDMKADVGLPFFAYENRAREIRGRILERVERGDDRNLEQINAVLLRLERAWLHQDGLTGRPWYRNLYAASDEHSGYAAWMLPELRRAKENESDAELQMAATLYRGVLERLHEQLNELDRLAE